MMTEPMLPCPHMRPAWYMCPHCLGLNTMPGSPDEHPMYGTGDLARFLGGSEDSFTGLLLVLFQKADPGNLARLERGFPEVHAAWAAWNAMSPAPTPAQLRAALGQD